MRLFVPLAVLCAVLLAACGDNNTHGAGVDGGTGGIGGTGQADGGIAKGIDGGAPGSDASVGPPTCGDGHTDTSTGEQCDDGNTTNGDGCDNNCTFSACGNGITAGGEACDDGNLNNWDGCNANCTQSVFTYLKASNPDVGDTAGFAVALSADGSTLAVGAEQEASNATGINGNQTDNSLMGAGAVYVFVRNGGAWTQQAYVKASNTGVQDRFGHSLALSADGATLAVGAEQEDSASPSDPTNNAALTAGAVYVFSRTGTTWAQQAYVKAATPAAGDEFGHTVALSGDGATLAVGAVSEDGSATGINGVPDRKALNAGAAYVFVLGNGAWTQQAYVKASNTEASDGFGTSVALANDGSTLAVGAGHESSGSADPTDNSKSDAGAVYVFSRTGTAWAQQAYVKTAAPAVGDDFGVAVALASDGSTLVAGADGVTGAKGAAYVFARSGATWAPAATLTAGNGAAADEFGAAVALSADGSHIAVGASGESSNATGVGGNPADNSKLRSGATYVFANTGAGKTWVQASYVKAFNTDAADLFGSSVALSHDGGMLAVGAPFESSKASGINGDQTDNSLGQSGAAYVYQ